MEGVLIEVVCLVSFLVSFFCVCGFSSLAFCCMGRWFDTLLFLSLFRCFRRVTGRFDSSGSDALWRIYTTCNSGLCLRGSAGGPSYNACTVFTQNK